MKKFFLFLIIIATMISLTAQGPAILATSDFISTIDKSFQVGEFDEKVTAIVPENSFNVDMDIQWDAEMEAKSSKAKADAYLRISYLLPNGDKKTIFQLSQGQHDSGTIHLPKGHKLVVELYAGQYQFLLTKSGVKSSCHLKIPTVLVKATETTSLYGFLFNVSGPVNVERWVWNFSDGVESTGESVEHRFPTPGHYIILLQGFQGTQMIQSLRSDLIVPDFAEFHPDLSPLEGAVEFNVSGQVKLKNHYGQESACSWNFGDGTEPVSGDAVNHVYKTVGRHTVTLSVSSASFGRSLTRTWEINSRPMYIINQADVTPLAGVIPLTIKALADPIAEGSPMNIKYNWNFGDGETSDLAHAEHVFVNPGEYTVTLKVWDENHPSFELPPRSYLVRALPPVVQINPQVNPTQGPIPLKVNFHPYLFTQGSPVNITFHWDFGDGATSDQAEPEHVYAKPGVYNVSLLVKETIHSIVVSGFLRITAQAPQITAVGKVTPTSGSAPLTINCIADPKIEGTPTELVYEWDFGDGEKANGRQVAHAYNKAGTYTVKLTISDRATNYEGVSSSVSFTVTVKAKP